MRPRAVCFLSVLLAVVAANVAQADVRWRERQLVLEPEAGATQVAGEFTFVNTGVEPVRVIEVKTGCGCTAATLDQEAVAPGAVGRVRATYHIGDRKGRQSVAVTVVTEATRRETHNLVIEVDIKESLTLTPRLVYWRVGEEPVTKTLQARLAPGFRIVAVETGSDDFVVEMQPTNPEAAVLRVTPRDTWAKRVATLQVRVAQEAKEPVLTTLVLRVL